MRTYPALASLQAAMLMIISTGVLAAEHESIGTFDFPTSGSPQAQVHFELGVGYLHSFGFIQAQREFKLAQEIEPDFAMAFHVTSALPTGFLSAPETSAYSGADTVDIVIKGVGAHGASPHTGIDPIVLGSQIVMGLQTVVSRSLAPRRPGVITVGSFHSGTKHNIISDRAELQLTVRNTNLQTRDTLLEGIERIAVNMGRVAGLPEDKLPEVIILDESTPPTINNDALVRRLRAVWQTNLGSDRVTNIASQSMGAEDFPSFTTEPEIPSVYFSVGGTSEEDLKAAISGTGPKIASHHSPLFKIEPIRIGNDFRKDSRW